MNEYTVHIYVAAPGTPLLLDGGTSLPGHMFYAIEHAGLKLSFGFAPIAHGQMNGPGQIYKTDANNYQKPLYLRTLEISSTQHGKLKEFGDNPMRFGFSTTYQDVRNNCVDFTWAALNHAGIHARSSLSGKALKTYEGSLKPTNNVNDIQTILAPIPSSKLNTEKRNPMPARNLKQWLLSDAKPPNAQARV